LIAGALKLDLAELICGFVHDDASGPGTSRGRLGADRALRVQLSAIVSILLKACNVL
jgi:hypothetical protein